MGYRQTSNTNPIDYLIIDIMKDLFISLSLFYARSSLIKTRMYSTLHLHFYSDLFNYTRISFSLRVRDKEINYDDDREEYASIYIYRSK